VSFSGKKSAAVTGYRVKISIHSRIKEVIAEQRLKILAV
jgi:hypothetical protein